MMDNQRCHPVRSWGFVGLGVLVATLGSAVASAQEARANPLPSKTRPCSVATATGAYGYYRTGSTPDGPLAALGRFVLDGSGNATNAQIISRNGEYEEASGEFSYAVNPDCTGRFFIEDFEIARILVVDDGRGIYLLSETPGNAVYGVALAIHPR